MATDPATAVTQSSRLDQYIARELEQTGGRLRTAEVLSAILAATAWAMAGTMSLALVDTWLVPLSSFWRLGGLVLLVGGAIAILLWGALPPLVRRINPHYVARMIERSGSEFHNSLLTWLFVRAQPERTRAAVAGAVASHAASNLSELDEDRRVDFGRTIRLGVLVAGLLAVFVAYLLLSPRNPWTSLGRILAPAARLAPASAVNVTKVAPGDVTLFYGDRLRVTASVKGKHQPEDVRIVYSSVDGQLLQQQVAMSPGESGEYVGEVSGGPDGIQGDLVYHVEAGDGRSPGYRVTVRPSPTITVNTVTIQPPAYTRLPESRQQGRGDIHAPEGSRVRITATANQPVKIAWIELVTAPQAGAALANGENITVVQSINMAVEQPDDGEPRAAQGEFILFLNPGRTGQDFTHYRLRFRTADDQRNEIASLHPVLIIPDAGPEVRIVRPEAEEVSVPVNGALPVEVHAADLDYEISSVQLVLDHRGSRLHDQQLELPQDRANQQVTSRWLLRPAKLQLKPGDEVVMFARALDNRMSPNSYAPDPNEAVSSSRLIRVTEADPNAESGDQAAATGNEQGPASEQPGQPTSDPPDQPAPGQSDPTQSDASGTPQEDQPDPSDSSNPSKPSDGSESSPGSESGDQQSGDQQTGDQQTGDQQAGDQQSGDQQSGDQAGNSSGSQSASSGAQGSESTGEQSGSGSSQPSDSRGSGQSDPAASSGAQGSSAGQSEDGTGNEPGGAGQPSAQNPATAKDGAGSAGQPGSAESSQSVAGNESGSQPGSGNAGTNSTGPETADGPSSETGENGQSGNGARDRSLQDGQRQPLGKQATDGDVFEALQEYLNDNSSAGNGSGENQNQQSGSQSESGSGQRSGGQPPGTQSPAGQSSGNQSAADQTSPSQSGDSQAGSSQSSSADSGQGETSGAESGDRQSAGDETGGREPGGGEAAENAAGDADSSASESGGEPSGGQQTSGMAGQGEQGEEPGSGQASDSGQPEGNDPGAQPGDQSSGDPSSNDPSASQQASPGESSDPSSSSGSPDSSAESQPGASSSGDGESGKSGDSDSGASGGNSQPSSQSGAPSGANNSQSTSGGSAAMQGGSGGQPTSAAAAAPPDPSQIALPPEEAAQVDYARSATDLVLEKLEQEQDRPADPALLDRLNWTDEQLRDFLQRWKAMKDAAREGNPADQQRYRDALRSLGLRRQGQNPDRVRGATDELQGLGEDGGVNRPPAELAPEFNAFMKSRSRLDGQSGDR